MLWKTLIALVVVLLLAGGAVWLFGPREPVETTIRFDPAAIGADADAYLARTEADIPNLRENAQKEIVWAYPASRARTPISIVYVHGFSAAKGETRPLADQVAASLGANLFYTRLTGHGRDGAAMEQADVNAWLNDLAEAVAIGREIGNRVIVIGTSTGGTLATFGATQPGLMQDVAGLVLISPNFGLLDRWAFALDLPWARDLLPLVGGETRGFDPLNDPQAENWTTRYPIGALVPMAAMVRETLRADISGIALPVLTLFSPNDQIVDPAATEAVMARWQGPHEVVEVPASGDPASHVLAGDIVSPQTTDDLAARIVSWAEALPPTD
ncbi:alpha/beta hydrolase [Aurantimonas coralicida]|uniref:alpha/beta hydrolase n=1 Tax=Aurantimonas coralicida TaxID=182270 RepID=UPI001D198638|nr:alpha/beta fold hydrolase [Aurantimonas coralicida]MCC4298820.1 alpha/beta hydrolase [Aurantimonas coralicida]